MEANDDDDDDVIAGFCTIIIFVDCIAGCMGRCIDIYKCFWLEITLPLTLGSIFQGLELIWDPSFVSFS
jgi:hypothetical protein